MYYDGEGVGMAADGAEDGHADDRAASEWAHVQATAHGWPPEQYVALLPALTRRACAFIRGTWGGVQARVAGTADGARDGTNGTGSNDRGTNGRGGGSNHRGSDHVGSSSRVPFLLYFAPPAPHAPWAPDEQWRGRSNWSIYADWVMQSDDVRVRPTTTMTTTPRRRWDVPTHRVSLTAHTRY
jgi:hypothetical protein